MLRYGGYILSQVCYLGLKVDREVIRPHWYVSQFDNRGRIERAQPRDLDAISSFISNGFATWEPITVGLGVPSAVANPYIRSRVELALQSRYCLMAFYLGKLVGTLVAREIYINHEVENTIQTEIKADYKDEIDAHMMNGCPDRGLARLKVLTEKWEKILPDLVSPTLNKILYIEYGYILPEYRGGFLGRILLQDIRQLAHHDGIAHFVTVVTSKSATRHYKQICDVKFVLPLSKFIDNGKRVLPPKEGMLQQSDMAVLVIGETDDPDSTETN